MFIGYVNIFAFCCLSCRKSLCDFFLSVLKTATYQFHHSLDWTSINFTVHLRHEQCPGNFNRVGKIEETQRLGTLHTLLSFIFFGAEWFFNVHDTRNVERNFQKFLLKKITSYQNLSLYIPCTRQNSYLSKNLLQVKYDVKLMSRYHLLNAGPLDLK